MLQNYDAFNPNLKEVTIMTYKVVVDVVYIIKKLINFSLLQNLCLINRTIIKGDIAILVHVVVYALKNIFI